MKKIHDDNLALANSYLQEGKELLIENRIRDAETVTLRAKEILIEENNLVMLASALNLQGVIYSAMDDDAACVSCFMEGLTVAKRAAELNQPVPEEYERLNSLMSALYNNIGSRYQSNNNYEKALEYFRLAEECLDYNQLEEDIPMRRRGYIIYLNFAECSGQLDKYDEAWEYLKKAEKYKDYGEGMKGTFSYTILEYKLKWFLGEEDYVRAHIEDLVYDAIYNHNGTDYMEDMRGVCNLFKWMKEYESWETVLKSMEEQRQLWDDIRFDMLVTEIWMEYYQQIEDNDNYLEKCKLLANLYLKLREQNHKSQADSIDIRIAYMENEQQRRKATERSVTDNLTGAGNRNKLEDDIKLLLPQMVSEQKTLGVGIVDIDYFKQQNDTYGHLQGDNCLKAVVDILKDTIGEAGSLYRFGGDEFIVLLPDATTDRIESIAKQIKEKLHEKAIPNEASRVLPEVTLSQGYVCLIPKLGDDIGCLLEMADKSLYHVKEQGRNDYFVN